MSLFNGDNSGYIMWLAYLKGMPSTKFDYSTFAAKTSNYANDSSTSVCFKGLETNIAQIQDTYKQSSTRLIVLGVTRAIDDLSQYFYSTLGATGMLDVLVRYVELDRNSNAWLVRREWAFAGGVTAGLQYQVDGTTRMEGVEMHFAQVQVSDFSVTDSKKPESNVMYSQVVTSLDIRDNTKYRGLDVATLGGGAPLYQSLVTKS